MKKNKKVQQIIVITFGSLLAIGFLFLMYNSGEDDKVYNGDVKKVIDPETGNASYINMGVPVRQDNTVIEETLTEKYDRLRKDSISNANIDRINMSDGATSLAGVSSMGSSATANSKLDFSEAEPIINDDAYSNSNDWLAPKKSRSYNNYESSSSNSRSGSYESAPLQTNNSQNTTDMDEYKRLLEARNLQLSNNGDISREVETNKGAVNSSEGVSSVHIRSSIFKTQWVLPGDRVKIILTKPLVYKGNIFERNTVVYAFVSIKESRIYLDVQNINGIELSLKAYDIQDNIEGLYSKRAGELWKQFETESNRNTFNEVAQNVGGTSQLLNSSVRALGNFFTRKRMRDSDKIPLINDHELILSNSN